MDKIQEDLEAFICKDVVENIIMKYLHGIGFKWYRVGGGYEKRFYKEHFLV